MIIDHPKTLRKTLLKIIAMPEDNDIIVYNQKFATLRGKNVKEIYNTNFREYTEISKEYIDLSNKLKEYEDFINNLSLVNKNYGEKDYIAKIQQLETLYAQKFKTIKDLEKKIVIYENKIKEINTKIDNQKLLSEQFVQNLKKEKTELLNKKNIELGEVQTCVNFFKDYYEEYVSIIKMLEKEIEAEQNLLKRSEEKNSMCEYCGRRYYPSPERMRERIDSLESRLSSHNDKFFKLKEKQNYYQTRLKELQAEISSLKHEIKVSTHLYVKKSPKILELEGQKFEIFEEINSLQNELIENQEKQGYEYKRIKREIEVYKTSFSNYTEAKRISKEMQEIQQEIKPLKEKMYEYENNLEILADFLEMKYKVYENNLNIFFDRRVKLKLFERIDQKFKNICEIKFDNIDITYLNPEQRLELNKIIVQKLKKMSGGDEDYD